MSYDDKGRRVLHGHPSQWEDECKALREQNTELALQVLASHGQAEEAYKAQQQAEARVQELEQTLREIGQWCAACDGDRWALGMLVGRIEATVEELLPKQEQG